MTNQPKWKFIANLGDATPLQYGGYFLYRDITGIYAEDAEYISELYDNGKWIIYRFTLEQFKNHNGHLIPVNYNSTWPYSIDRYVEWFDDKLNRIADFGGITLRKLMDYFCSEDIIERALAYELLGQFCGWENLDQYPQKYTQAELNKKYVWYHTHPNRTK